MMDIVVPETCWASNKICNKNHLLHLVGILFPHSITNIQPSLKWTVSNRNQEHITTLQQYLAKIQDDILP